MEKNESQQSVIENEVMKDDDRVMDVDVHKSSFSLDIGHYVGAKIDDFLKKNLLTNHWSPPENYNFPYSTHRKQGKEEKRYAGHQYLRKFDWLVFSDVKKGFFCKCCFLFKKDTNTPVCKLVTDPLVTFAKLLGKDGNLVTHELNKYHRESVVAAKEFLKVIDNPQLSIINKINSDRLEQVKENRKRLVPILESIIFLGKQNISFRGHRDDGPILKESSKNEGNFRELLRLRLNSGDSNLKAHLENSSARATYSSKTTQNELIRFCGDEILSSIISQMNDAKYYSIMFDETTDIANFSQLSLVLRYFWKRSVHEDFIGFLDVQTEISEINEHFDQTMELRASGENLGHIVLNKLKAMGINLDYCVGITTDGCSVMTSNDCGAVKTVLDEAKNATYCPCYNHKLNLSISKSSTVQEVRNSVGLMKDIIAFFKASSKRSRILKNVMGHQLHGLCETRWVERHDGVIQFQSCISKIIETLECVAKWKDIHAAAKAKSLKCSLSNGEFIVSMMCLANLLTCTLQLSRFFQKTQTDMKSANDILQETLTILRRKRGKSVEVFSNIFEEAKNIAEEIDAEIKVPRLANIQKNRSNYPCDSAEDYYRKAIFIPLLDHVIEDLKFRFPEETLNLFDLFVLFPTNDDESECEEAVNRLSNKYAYLFNKSTDIFKKMLSSELEFYRLHCENKKITSCSALELLDHCDDEVFPIVTTLLKILVTLPISSCSAERSFSSLRRIKDWLRSTMSEDRLDGLALMNIHWNVKINVEKVIDRFAKNRNHRIDFVL